MDFGRNVGNLAVLLFALIQSIALVYVEDTFVLCYFDLIEPPPEYEEFDLDSETKTKCAIVCLGDRQCFGFDVCENTYSSGHICRLRNESSVANCTVEPGPDVTPKHDDCAFYRRVSIN
jgi:hypothetical protein